MQVAHFHSAAGVHFQLQVGVFNCQQVLTKICFRYLLGCKQSLTERRKTGFYLPRKHKHKRNALTLIII